MKPMSAHELARQLLAGPDDPVVALASERAYEIDTAELDISTWWWVGDSPEGVRFGGAIVLSGDGRLDE